MYEVAVNRQGNKGEKLNTIGQEMAHLTNQPGPIPIGSGKIGLVIGDILFLHGGICTESYGVVPGKEGRCSSAKEWVEELNAWKDQEVQNFCKNPLFYKD